MKISKNNSIANEQSKFWLQVATVVLLAVMAFQLNGLNAKIGTVGTGNTGGSAAAPTPTAAAPTPTPSAPTVPTDMVELMDDDAVKGDADAPVTIVEWSDFECPFCARFYSETLSQIDEQYIKTGKVKLVFRDFPLSFHPNAQKASEAAECAKDQGKFWEMHDKLFEDGVKGGVASFKAAAGALGLDQAKFDACLDSGEKADEVKQDMADGQAAGVRGTPGFVINGQLVSGAQPFVNFQRIIDAELAK